MRKLLILVLFCLTFVQTMYGQNFHKLKPGDKVPEVTFSILKNGKFVNAKLSDYKGKLVILDYWNIWCSSCLAAFPKLAQLQKEFTSEIVVLPVSFLHTKPVIADFIAKRKGTENEIELPVAVFENKNNPLFQNLPTTGYPYEAWIDKNGNFLMASAASDVTASNISAVLKGKHVDFKPKNQQLSFDREKPLLIYNNGGPDSAFVFRSLITGSIDSISKISGRFSGTSGQTKLHLSILNGSILEMAKLSLREGKSIDVYNHYVVFEGSDSLRRRLFLDAKDLKTIRAWQAENYYCYDLTIPPGFTVKEGYTFMHQDIDRFFKIQTSIENRLMNCVVLKRTDSIDRIATKAIADQTRISKTEIDLVRRNLSYLLSSLNDRQAPILIDETGYKGNVDLKIVRSGEFDIDALNTQLEQYGLKFEKAQRMLPVVVVKQKSNGN